MKRNNSIGARIEAVRVECGLTQQQLADKVGVSREIINHWEANTRKVKAEHIIKLSQALGVSSDYLLGLTNAKTSDIGVREICDKTGLEEELVEWLLNNRQSRSVEALNRLFLENNSVNVLDKIFPGWTNFSVFLSQLSDYLDCVDSCEQDVCSLKEIQDDFSAAQRKEWQEEIVSKYYKLRYQRYECIDWITKCFDRIEGDLYCYAGPLALEEDDLADTSIARMKDESYFGE